MANKITVQDFRAYARISDSESDLELQKYLDAAEHFISRECGKDYDQLPDSESLYMAVKVKALSYINQKSFPSKAILEAVNQEVLNHIGAAMDATAKTVYQKDSDV